MLLRFVSNFQAWRNLLLQSSEQLELYVQVSFKNLSFHEVTFICMCAHSCQRATWSSPCLLLPRRLQGQMQGVRVKDARLYLLNHSLSTSSLRLWSLNKQYNESRRLFTWAGPLVNPRCHRSVYGHLGAISHESRYSQCRFDSPHPKFLEPEMFSSSV